METTTEEFIGSPHPDFRGGWVQKLDGAFAGAFVLREGYHAQTLRVMDLDGIYEEIEWWARIWWEPTTDGVRYKPFREAAAEWWADVYRFCAGDA